MPTRLNEPSRTFFRPTARGGAPSLPWQSYLKAASCRGVLLPRSSERPFPPPRTSLRSRLVRLHPRLGKAQGASEQLGDPCQIQRDPD